jgi:hypothetical protein
MKKPLLLIFIFLNLILAGFAQTIKPEDAAKYVGQVVTVCGKIFDGKYLDNIKGKPTLLNMGAAYPKQPLTIVIWDDLRSKLAYKPEQKWLNKQICVTGKVEIYKGRVEIVVDKEIEIKG